MTDQVRLWSDELARDPSSLVFLPLGETLRQRGQLDLARKVTMRGLERHPGNPEAHDLLARIHADRGDHQSALDEWDVVLRIIPGHVGALKGIAFIRFQQGQPQEAERLLREAQAGVHAAPSSETSPEQLEAAITTVRRSGTVTATPASPSTADPQALFRDLLTADQHAMLLDHEGLVLAGAYVSADGRDVAQDVGASLSGVSEEARRTTRHLDIGAWRSIAFETESAVVALAPSITGTSDGGLLVLAAAPSTPLGLLRRLVDRCGARVTAWLGAAP